MPSFRRFTGIGLRGFDSENFLLLCPFDTLPFCFLTWPGHFAIVLHGSPPSLISTPTILNGLRTNFWGTTALRSRLLTVYSHTLFCSKSKGTCTNIYWWAGHQETQRVRNSRAISSLVVLHIGIGELPLHVMGPIRSAGNGKQYFLGIYIYIHTHRRSSRSSQPAILAHDVPIFLAYFLLRNPIHRFQEYRERYKLYSVLNRQQRVLFHKMQHLPLCLTPSPNFAILHVMEY